MKLEAKSRLEETKEHSPLGPVPEWKSLKSKPTNANYVAYMTVIHKLMNKKYFQGKLSNCDIAIHSRPNPVALWYNKNEKPSKFPKGAITISADVFLTTDAIAQCTMLHEMCHQAVDEIDKSSLAEKEANLKEDDGHGVLWKKWMVKVGLPPKSTYSRHEINVFKIGLHQKLDQKNTPITNPKTGQFVKCFDAGDDNKKRIGLLGKCDPIGRDLWWDFIYHIGNKIVLEELSNPRFYKIEDGEDIENKEKAELKAFLRKKKD